MPKGRKMSRMKSGDSKAQACSPLTSHALYKLAVTTRIHTGPSTHSSVRRGGSLPPCSGSDSSSGRGCPCIPSLGVSGATCPSPRAPCPHASPGTVPLCLNPSQHCTLAKDLTMGLSIMPRRKIRSSSAAPVALGRDPRLSRTCCMAGGKEQPVRHTGAS